MTFLHEEPEKFKELIDRVAQDIGIPAAHLEKEYYVTMFLKQLSEIDRTVVFKGGTSIAMCDGGVIKRFSEYIDLNYNNGRMHPTENMRRTFKKSIIKSGETIGLVLENAGEIRSRRDYNLYRYNYPNFYSDIAMKPNIDVETSVKSPSFPVEERSVESILGKYLRDNGHEELAKATGLIGFTLSTQTLERTLTDKIFAVGDYYFTKELDRHSRHLYDIYKLSTEVDMTSDEYKKLFSEVLLVREKQPGNITAGLEYNLLDILKKVIDEDVYKEDYDNVTRFFLHEDVSYDTVKDNLGNIVETLERLNIYSEAKENQLENNIKKL